MKHISKCLAAAGSISVQGALPIQVFHCGRQYGSITCVLLLQPVQIGRNVPPIQVPHYHRYYNLNVTCSMNWQGHATCLNNHYHQFAGAMSVIQAIDFPQLSCFFLVYVYFYPSFQFHRFLEFYCNYSLTLHMHYNITPSNPICLAPMMQLAQIAGCWAVF